LDDRIRNTFSHLGLVELQEQVFVGMMENSEKQLDQLFELGKEVDKGFEKILSSLRST
jgi:hypothetical protein